VQGNVLSNLVGEEMGDGLACANHHTDANLHESQQKNQMKLKNWHARMDSYKIQEHICMCTKTWCTWIRIEEN
jgi:hypothetical protein